jgi:preprotein translocase subunit SecA
VLADLTYYFLFGNTDNDTMLSLECYIVYELHALRPSIRALRKNYPEFFKLHQSFYLDVLNNKKEQFLMEKYYAIGKSLLTDNDGEPDECDCEMCRERRAQQDDDGFSFFNLPDDDFGQQTPFVRETPKVGRNDPCPCGSGKKYKKCCG